MMPDREKVIKSIKACAHHPNHDCQSCEYCDDHLWCYNDQLIDDLLSLLKEQEAVEPIRAGLEDCACSWWYVCPKCRIAIDYKDHYCRHCGREFIWNERETGSKTGSETD